MADLKPIYLPQTNAANAAQPHAAEVKGDSPCPCCGCITIPNGGDALAYICPVCLWEIDLFTHDENQPSDQNHGLTLAQARQNYARCGAVLPRLQQYSRPPLPQEISIDNAGKY